MTSTIAIGNGFGVACAADTMTTVGHHRRTNDGAIKLMPLKKPHSLAVMHAGSVFVHGIPYSSHIANWQESLADQTFNKVSDYVDSFMAYLEQSIVDNYSPEELHRDYLEEWDRRCRAIRRNLKRKDALNPKGITRHFEGLLTRHGKKGNRTPPHFAKRVFAELGQSSVSNILEQESRRNGSPNPEHLSVEGVMDQVFGDAFDDRARAVAVEFSHFFLGEFHPTDGGGTLSFTGFGSRELTPVTVEVRIEAFAMGRLFAYDPMVSVATRHCPSGGYSLMETMGHSDEIWRLVNQVGLSPHYSARVIRDSLRDLQNATVTAESSEEQVDPECEQISEDRQLTEPSADERLSLAQAEIEMSLARIEGSNMHRVRGTIAGANLKTLASMAVRLVQLENLALDLGGELQTVGSEVLVGLITKADGFYWVDALTGEPRERRVAS